MIGIERRFSDDTRLIDLTVGDLKELIASLIPESKQIEAKKYVYGIKGISELFHCSHTTAIELKKGKIAKAVKQHRKKIIVDVNLALELFGRKK